MVQLITLLVFGARVNIAVVSNCIHVASELGWIPGVPLTPVHIGDLQSVVTVQFSALIQNEQGRSELLQSVTVPAVLLPLGASISIRIGVIARSRRSPSHNAKICIIGIIERMRIIRDFFIRYWDKIVLIRDYTLIIYLSSHKKQKVHTRSWGLFAFFQYIKSFQ